MAGEQSKLRVRFAPTPHEARLYAMIEGLLLLALFWPVLLPWRALMLGERLAASALGAYLGLLHVGLPCCTAAGRFWRAELPQGAAQAITAILGMPGAGRTDRGGATAARSAAPRPPPLTLLNVRSLLPRIDLQGGAFAAAFIAHLLFSRGGVRRLLWGAGGGRAATACCRR